jgi:hypothetical protein
VLNRGRENGLRKLPSSGTLVDGLQIKVMKRSCALFGWLVLPTLILAQDHTRRDTHEMHRLHQDPQAYIAMLDDPQRDAYQKPHEVITARNLKEGEVIADIGAGSGMGGIPSCESAGWRMRPQGRSG